jgi:hypothetical protein
VLVSDVNIKGLSMICEFLLHSRAVTISNPFSKGLSMNRNASVYLLLILALIASSRPAFAQGPPASAGNAGLAAQIAALTARIAALESRLTSMETVDEADVPGTYQWVSLGVEMNGGVPARVGTHGSTVILTLRAGGTGDVTEATGGPCQLTLVSPSNAHCQEDPEAGPLPMPVTWSFAAGQITVTFPDNDTVTWTATTTGVFAHSISIEFLPNNTWSQMGVIIKLGNP